MKASNAQLRKALQQLRDSDSSWASSSEGKSVLAKASAGDRARSGVNEQKRGQRHRKLAAGVAAAAVVVTVATGMAVTRLISTPDDSGTNQSSAAEKQADPSTGGNSSGTTRPGVASRPPGYIFDSLAQLFANSELVVRGTVTSTGTEVLLDGSGLMARTVDVRVDDVYFARRGDTPSSVSMQQGVLAGDNETVSVSGEEPLLEVGDQAVLFLVHQDVNQQGEYTIVAPPGVWAVKDGTLQTQAPDKAARTVDGRKLVDVEADLPQAIEESRTLEPLPNGPSPAAGW